jgi:hypothetical protein
MRAPTQNLILNVHLESVKLMRGEFLMTCKHRKQKLAVFFIMSSRITFGGTEAVATAVSIIVHNSRDVGAPSAPHDGRGPRKEEDSKSNEKVPGDTSEFCARRGPRS